MSDEFKPNEHLMKVSGRDYLPVAARVLWFRQDHPDWGIITTIEQLDIEQQYAVFRAQILDVEGRLLATATKMESRAGFPDYAEKAETGAVGRALALLGYGTMAAMEEDPKRPADAPQDRAPKGRAAPDSNGDRKAAQERAPSASGPAADKARAAFFVDFKQHVPGIDGKEHEGWRHWIYGLLLRKERPVDPEGWPAEYWQRLHTALTDAIAAKSLGHLVSDAQQRASDVFDESHPVQQGKAAA
jgi:hypothetical protein